MQELVNEIPSERDYDSAWNLALRGTRVEFCDGYVRVQDPVETWYCSLPSWIDAETVWCETIDHNQEDPQSYLYRVLYSLCSPIYSSVGFVRGSKEEQVKMFTCLTKNQGMKLSEVPKSLRKDVSARLSRTGKS